MNYLIIPDVHLRIDRVQSIIEQNNFDRLISLGDWFDDFGDDEMDAAETAEYILHLNKTLGDKFTWLLGNHDVIYVYPQVQNYYWCSGNTKEKLEAIQKVFDGKLDRSKLKLCEVLNIEGVDKPIILSHAGASEYHFSRPTAKDGDRIDIKYLQERCTAALMNCTLGQPDPIMFAGRARGGRSQIGGITWMDWNREYLSLPGFSQIVGHTPMACPSVLDDEMCNIRSDEGKSMDSTACSDITKITYTLQKDTQMNVNLDTHLRHYATLRDNVFTVHTYDPAA